MAGTLTITSVKQGNNLNLAPAIAESKRRYIESLQDGELVEIKYKVYKSPKTNKQLGAHFGLMLAATVLELHDRGEDTSLLLRIDRPTGVPITKDRLKDYLYSVCPIYRDGKIISLSDATIDETSKHFNECRNYIASQWNIHIPDPNPDWRNK